MTSLSRYILLRHAGPYAFGCCLIVFVLVVDVILQMMDQVLSKGLDFDVAGRLFVYNLAWIIALAVPMAVLVAVLMAFGKLSADNEIMAVKSSGIGLMRLVRPVLFAAALLTVIMIVFNDRVLPDWNHRARSIAADLKRRKAALVLKQKEGIFIRDVGSYSLLIGRIDERANTLHDIIVYDSGRPGPPTSLHADSGELQILEDGRYMQLTLYDGEYNRVDPDHPERFVRSTFARQVIHIKDSDRAFNQYRSSYRSDREMDIAAMYASVDKYRAEELRSVAVMDSLVIGFLTAVGRPALSRPALSDSTPARDGPQGRLGSSSDAGEFRPWAKDVMGRLQKQTRLNRNRQRRANAFLVEIHKKFSIAAACFVFVLMGAPLGVIVRSRGAAVSVAVSIAFFFAYWMFLIGGEELADRGYVSPALAMWAPNLLFGAIGALLLRATALDRSLLRLRRAPAATGDSAAQGGGES